MSLIVFSESKIYNLPLLIDMKITIVLVYTHEDNIKSLTENGLGVSLR